MKIPYALLKPVYFSLFVLVSLAACKDKKDPEPPAVDNNPIVGKWHLTAITPESANTPIPAIDFVKTVAPCVFDLKLTFNADNTLVASDCPSAVTAISPFVPVGNDAKWKVNGDRLTLSRGTTSQEFKITQSQTDLTVVVNTTTDTTKPAVNALLHFKRL